MKKLVIIFGVIIIICLAIVLCLKFNSSNYITAKNNELSTKTYIGKNLTINNQLLVFYDKPEIEKTAKPMTILPKETKISVLYSDRDWSEIEWFCNIDRKNKTAWASNLRLLYSINESKNKNKYISAMTSYMLRIIEKDIPSLKKKSTDYIEKENYKKAIKCSTKLINSIYFVANEYTPLASELSASYFRKSFALYNLKDYKLALSDINEAIRINKQDNLAYAHRANIYYEMGYYSKAKEDYLTAKKFLKEEGLESAVIDINNKLQMIDALLKQAQ